MNLNRYIQKHIDELHSGHISKLHALVVSADIESSLLESKFFEVFASDSVRIKDTFKKLHDSTLEHSARIKEMLEMIRENTLENTNIE